MRDARRSVRAAMQGVVLRWVAARGGTPGSKPLRDLFCARPDTFAGRVARALFVWIKLALSALRLVET